MLGWIVAVRLRRDPCRHHLAIRYGPTSIATAIDIAPPRNIPVERRLVFKQLQILILIMSYSNEFDFPELGTTISFRDYRWDVLKKIYDGIFSHVYLLRDVTDKRKLYAMKVEKQEGCERPVLKLDVAVLSQMRSVIGFPRMLVAGRTSTFKFCVMQLVGPDLRALMFAMPNKRFSPSTAYRIALQTLDRLEKLHDAGYLNRDVKSQNFAIGIGRESSIIYMLDFGLTRKYRSADGTALKRRGCGPCVGTFPFTPLASATMKDQAPKDDLEGWFYMIMEVFLGFLPWHNARITLDHGLTREWKQFARDGFRNEMLAMLPSEFTSIFNNIINTRFEQRPKYHFIQRMISNSATRHGIRLNIPYDWQVEPSLLNLMEQATSYGHNHKIIRKIADEPEITTVLEETVDNAITTAVS
ncbi:hypothetical protein RB195_012768 [Necator americanus]|uniref:Protein kinase domain-containing protein n=1 Tax=Necator americanus TaxID=51031 RepID=A0ABR1DSG6_NECAM